MKVFARTKQKQTVAVGVATPINKLILSFCDVFAQRVDFYRAINYRRAAEINSGTKQQTPEIKLIDFKD